MEKSYLYIYIYIPLFLKLPSGYSVNYTTKTNKLCEN